MNTIAKIKLQPALWVEQIAANQYILIGLDGAYCDNWLSTPIFPDQEDAKTFAHSNGYQIVGGQQ